MVPIPTPALSLLELLTDDVLEDVELLVLLEDDEILVELLEL